jgi:hypothetical protein
MKKIKGNRGIPPLFHSSFLILPPGVFLCVLCGEIPLNPRS